MDISSQLTESPGLIALINNPTEEDLLKVIYSKNTLDSIIRDLPDEYITPKVATIALCLTKKWSEESLSIWFDKFFPHTPQEYQEKIFKAIYSCLPDKRWSGLVEFVHKDTDLFVHLFSKVDYPSSDLIDFYLSICIDYDYIGVAKKGAEYAIINDALTDNIAGRLDDKQQEAIIDTFKGVPTPDRDWYGLDYKDIRIDFENIRKFITNEKIYKKGKCYIDVLVKEMQDNQNGGKDLIDKAKQELK